MKIDLLKTEIHHKMALNYGLLWMNGNNWKAISRLLKDYLWLLNRIIEVLNTCINKLFSQGRFEAILRLSMLCVNLMIRGSNVCVKFGNVQVTGMISPSLISVMRFPGKARLLSHWTNRRFFFHLDPKMLSTDLNFVFTSQRHISKEIMVKAYF